MGSGPPDKKPTNPQSGEQQEESGIVGVNVDAITALNTAIGGVQLLDEVVTHIKSAADAVDNAKGNAIADINSHIEVNAKKRIDELAVSAVKSAMKAYKALWTLIDKFLGEERRR